MDRVDLGRANYKAYGEAVGGKTWDGRPIPEWDALTPTIQAGWTAGADAVVQTCREKEVQDGTQQ